MRALRRLKQHNVSASEKRVFLLSFMILFFVIFDGIIMYLSPIVMQRAKIPLGLMGLILGFSGLINFFCINIVDPPRGRPFGGGGVHLSSNVDNNFLNYL